MPETRRSPETDQFDDACRVGVVHLPSPTNERLRLHQEYAMRTGGYDEIAKVEAGERGWVNFHDLVNALGMEGAIRAVSQCSWLSESDWSTAHKGGDCIECQEVAHA